jgi:hypothetical protein
MNSFLKKTNESVTTLPLKMVCGHNSDTFYAKVEEEMYQVVRIKRTMVEQVLEHTVIFKTKH